MVGPDWGMARANGRVVGPDRGMARANGWASGIPWRRRGDRDSAGGPAGIDREAGGGWVDAEQRGLLPAGAPGAEEGRGGGGIGAHQGGRRRRARGIKGVVREEPSPLPRLVDDFSVVVAIK